MKTAKEHMEQAMRACPHTMKYDRISGCLDCAEAAITATRAEVVEWCAQRIETFGRQYTEPSATEMPDGIDSESGAMLGRWWAKELRRQWAWSQQGASETNALDVIEADLQTACDKAGVRMGTPRRVQQEPKT